MVTGALIYFISLQMTTSVFVTNMASMIGIGVAIDYSLFILARYREERRAGRDRDEARAEALSTSGLAVTFSGLAVIVSLAGLWMVDNQALRSMALGAMTVVAVSILTATTLLPALIAMLGDRVLPGGVVAKVLRFVKTASSAAAARRRRDRRRGAASGSAGRAGSWRGPGPPSSASARSCSSSPSRCSRWRPAPQALTQFPKGSDVRVGNELASEQLGGGTDPIQIVATFAGAPAAPTAPPSPASPRELEATPGVSARRAARLRRRQRPDPGDLERPQRVRRGDRRWSSACATPSSRPPPWRGRRPSTSAAKPPAATTSATRSAARCGRSSASSSRSASSS